LWFGVQIDNNLQAGVYKGHIRLLLRLSPYSQAASFASSQIRVSLTINNTHSHPILDQGDSELWRLSRIRWLNSRR